MSITSRLCAVHRSVNEEDRRIAREERMRVLEKIAAEAALLCKSKPRTKALDGLRASLSNLEMVGGLR